jgi:hypothetical protein
MIFGKDTSGHGCFLAVKPNHPKDDGEHGVPDVALSNAALPIAGANVVASPKIPSLAAHWYAATSVKHTAPSKTSAETTGGSSPARGLCPKSVHSTTARKFKLRHYLLPKKRGTIP